MGNKDSGWRPKGGLDTYKGREVWDFEHGPHEINQGVVDGDIELLTDEERAERAESHTGGDDEELSEG